MWDNRYRPLVAGEIIKEGDEVLTDSHIGWQRDSLCVGQAAPDPNYTAHRMYRRLKTEGAPHPTPEERVEAALKEWREDAGDLRIHFADAIREAEAAGEARGRAMECAEHSPGITWAQRREALSQKLGRKPTLNELLQEARHHKMTPDEIEEQRKSWVRAMTYRCEHGIADFEQCPDCRARTDKESSDD